MNDDDVDPSADNPKRRNPRGPSDETSRVPPHVQAELLAALAPNGSIGRMTRQLGDLAKRATAALQPVLENLLPTLQVIAQFAYGVAVALQNALPQNWVLLKEWPDFDLIQQMLADEGLALAWVPSTEMLQRLIAADGAPARRQIIGANWSRLVDECEVQLSLVSAPRLKEQVGFARESIAALRNNTPAAAQALNASLLDTLVRSNLDPARLKELISAKRPAADIDSFAIREAFVLLGIYGAYTSWWPSQSASAPRSFSRHMSAHRVSRRQYNRINAVISLMHVTALIRHLDGEDRRERLLGESPPARPAGGTQAPSTNRNSE